jgi:soluble lytic murein transglycosylase-like protein
MQKFLSVTIIVACFYGLIFSTPASYIKSLLSPQSARNYQASELKELAHLAAVLHDIEPTVFLAQIRQESNFNQHARSKAGAIGVAQIMTSTAKGWSVDPNDPVQALDAAALHMSGYVGTYRKQGHDSRMAYKMALAAYNAGPGAVSKYKGIPPYAETQNYVKRIMPEQ